jgi:dihydrolipoamide dehydrogenase
MVIKIFTNVSNEVEKSYDEKVHLTFYTNGSKMETFTDKVMVAIGRKPNIEDIGLEKVGIQLKNGFINVDSRMKTNVPGIYAVGDVVGGKMFAHAAFAEGIVAAENIAGIDSEIDQRFIPSCVYTIPEIACVGLPEDEAISLGYDISVGKFPYTANGKALALGEREGFAKIIVEKKTNRILGAHIIGSNAADLISEALVAIRLEYTSEELGRTIHPHPTLSEVIMEAALAASKEAIHI